MSNCKKFRDKMIDCLEQQLKSDEQQLLFDHLAHCAACNTEYQKLSRLFDLLDKDSLTLPPRESFEAIRIATQQRMLAHKRFSIKNLARVLVPALAAAAILFIMLRPKNEKIEIRIPVADLLEDRDIASMAMAGVLDRDTFEGILAMEDQVLSDTQEAIDEMTSAEKKELIISLNQKYPLGT